MCNWRMGMWRQPIDAICDYFGERIAMYFSFLGFYTKVCNHMRPIHCLTNIHVCRRCVCQHQWASCAQSLYFLLGIRSVTFDQKHYTNGFVTDCAATGEYAAVAFCVLIMVWATVFLEYWKREVPLYFKHHSSP